ncbi:hypothetical protein, partial [Rhodoferax sp.]|uniref:hypothetical protein n=1 Tax=Rhodoferax sp. TaxID=50421 RepID=UPI002ACD62F5
VTTAGEGTKRVFLTAFNAEKFTVQRHNQIHRSCPVGIERPGPKLASKCVIRGPFSGTMRLKVARRLTFLPGEA